MNSIKNGVFIIDPLQNNQQAVPPQPGAAPNLPPAAPLVGPPADEQAQSLGAHMLAAGEEPQNIPNLINRVAQRMGIQVDPLINDIPMDEYQNFIDQRTNQLLNEYYPQDQQNHEVIRDQMRPRIRNAFKRNILAPEPNFGTLINDDDEEWLLIVNRDNNNPPQVESFRVRFPRLAEGTHAIVYHTYKELLMSSFVYLKWPN